MKVDFSRKDLIKDLEIGGKWDKDHKLWYVPKSVYTKYYKYIDEIIGAEKINWIKKQIATIGVGEVDKIVLLADKIYEKGYSGRDMLTYFERCETIDSRKKSSLLLSFHKVKKDFRNEKLFRLFMLIRCNNDLENVSFI